MFKTCQYTTNDVKVFTGLILMSVKDAQAEL
jgi:hypothetical protein